MYLWISLNHIYISSGTKCVLYSVSCWAPYPWASYVPLSTIGSPKQHVLPWAPYAPLSTMCSSEHLLLYPQDHPRHSGNGPAQLWRHQREGHRAAVHGVSQGIIYLLYVKFIHGIYLSHYCTDFAGATASIIALNAAIWKYAGDDAVLSIFWGCFTWFITFVEQHLGTTYITVWKLLITFETTVNFAISNKFRLCWFVFSNRFLYLVLLCHTNYKRS